MAFRMMTRVFLMMAMLVCMAGIGRADEAAVRAAIAKFAEGNGYASIEAGIDALGATADPLAASRISIGAGVEF